MIKVSDIQHSMIKVNTNDIINMDMDDIIYMIIASSSPVHNMNDMVIDMDKIRANININVYDHRVNRRGHDWQNLSGRSSHKYGPWHINMNIR